MGNGAGVNIEGQIVEYRPTFKMKPEWDHPWHRIGFAAGGFGCHPDTIGTAVVFEDLCDGEVSRSEGPYFHRVVGWEEAHAIYSACTNDEYRERALRRLEEIVGEATDPAKFQTR